jgi:TetR/AcrR family transcriptional regulator, transcriptional repressor for nem operon
MGRTSDARQRILDAACELMLTRSFGAVGVADICARADVRKGSFYYFFESKQALTLAAIDAHWQRQREGWLAILQTAHPALDRLRRLLEETAATQRAAQEARGMVSGCALANLALELSTQDHVVQARLQEIFAEQIALVEVTLQNAAAEGTLAAASATHAVARAIVAQMEGMVLFAKLGNDPDILDDLWRQTLRLLQVAEAVSA